MWTVVKGREKQKPEAEIILRRLLRVFKDDGINFEDGLGNGKNGLTFATPKSSIASDM